MKDLNKNKDVGEFTYNNSFPTKFNFYSLNLYVDFKYIKENGKQRKPYPEESSVELCTLHEMQHILQNQRGNRRSITDSERREQYGKEVERARIQLQNIPNLNYPDSDNPDDNNSYVIGKYLNFLLDNEDAYLWDLYYKDPAEIEAREVVHRFINKDKSFPKVFSEPSSFKKGGSITNYQILENTQQKGYGSFKYLIDGKEVGYIDFNYNLDKTLTSGMEKFKNELYIRLVTVDKEYRGQGIAKTLIQKVIDFAKSKEIEVVSLNRNDGIKCNYGSDYDNYLKSLYSSMGFKEKRTKEEADKIFDASPCDMYLDLKNKKNQVMKYEIGGVLTIDHDELLNTPVIIFPDGSKKYVTHKELINALLDRREEYIMSNADPLVIELLDNTIKDIQQKMEVMYNEKGGTLSSGENTPCLSVSLKVERSKHTKTGAPLIVLKIVGKLDREQYKSLESRVKAIGGYYSSYVTGFILKRDIDDQQLFKLGEGIVSSAPEITNEPEDVNEKGIVTVDSPNPTWHRVFIVHKDDKPVTDLDNLTHDEAKLKYEQYKDLPNSEITTWEERQKNKYGHVSLVKSMGMHINKKSELSLAEINESLKSIDEKIKALHHDNNGNPLDPDYANVLSDAEEKLFDMKKDIEDKSKLIVVDPDYTKVEETNTLSESQQQQIRNEATEQGNQLEEQRKKYPIVVEWSEGTAYGVGNLGFNNLNELQEFFLGMELPKGGYTKNKVYFKGLEGWYGNGSERIDLGYGKGDLNPKEEHVSDYMKKHYPNFDWDKLSEKEEIKDNDSIKIEDLKEQLIVLKDLLPDDEANQDIKDQIFIIEELIKDLGKETKMQDGGNLDDSEPTIEIEKVTPDERSGKKSKTKYSVNYQITVNGKLLEITGTLNPHKTGRSVEYKFEPDEFIDTESEEYWDENWEEIQEHILDKLDSKN